MRNRTGFCPKSVKNKWQEAFWRIFWLFVGHICHQELTEDWQESQVLLPSIETQTRHKKWCEKIAFLGQQEIFCSLCYKDDRRKDLTLSITQVNWKELELAANFSHQSLLRRRERERDPDLANCLLESSLLLFYLPGFNFQLILLKHKPLWVISFKLYAFYPGGKG